MIDLAHKLCLGKIKSENGQVVLRVNVRLEIQWSVLKQLDAAYNTLCCYRAQCGRPSLLSLRPRFHMSSLGFSNFGLPSAHMKLVL